MLRQLLSLKQTKVSFWKHLVWRHVYGANSKCTHHLNRLRLEENTSVNIDLFVGLFLGLFWFFILSLGFSYLVFALKLGHILLKRNQNGPPGVHWTQFCPQHLILISQMKVHTSTPEHWFQSPHLSISLSSSLSISLSLMRLFRMLMRWPSIGVGSCAIIFWTGAWADDLDFFLGGEQLSSFHNLSLN